MIRAITNCWLGGEGIKGFLSVSKKSKIFDEINARSKQNTFWKDINVAWLFRGEHSSDNAMPMQTRRVMGS